MKKRNPSEQTIYEILFKLKMIRSERPAEACWRVITRTREKTFLLSHNLPLRCNKSLNDSSRWAGRILFMFKWWLIDIIIICCETDFFSFLTLVRGFFVSLFQAELARFTIVRAIKRWNRDLPIKVIAG